MIAILAFVIMDCPFHTVFMQTPTSFSMLPFKRIAICGLGLIGGSILKTLRATGFSGHVTVFDSDAAVTQLACRQGFADTAAASPERLFLEHDLVVLCQPVGAIVQYLHDHGQELAAGPAIGVDVASVKSPVTEALQDLEAAAAARFVPSHPIAGKATHGWQSADAQLLKGKLCVLTPTPHTSPAAIDLAIQFWRTLGARTSLMAATEHDAVYAAVSHMPQVLSYAYLYGLATRHDNHDWLAYAGTGFQGFTRLGSSDPQLWADIATHNADALMEEIDNVSYALAMFRRHLERGNMGALQNAFTLARDLHAQSLQKNQAPSSRN